MTGSPRRIWLLVLCGTLASSPSSARIAAEASHPGDALRVRLHVALPSTDTMVVVYGVAQHHTRTEWSVVASRDAGGGWTVERAGEEGPGLLPVAPHPLPSSKGRLSIVQGQQLDRLLNDREVFSDEASGGDLAIGGYASEMEIINKHRTRRVGWAGKLSGKLGQVADLVIGPG